MAIKNKSGTKTKLYLYISRIIITLTLRIISTFKSSNDFYQKTTHVSIYSSQYADSQLT